MLGAMAGAPTGFEFLVRGDTVEVRHHGLRAAMLRKEAAAKFLADVERGDPQQVMARVTGNYKRGNERRGNGRP
jgi:hypothetical protein